MQDFCPLSLISGQVKGGGEERERGIFYRMAGMRSSAYAPAWCSVAQLVVGLLLLNARSLFAITLTYWGGLTRLQLAGCASLVHVLQGVVTAVLQNRRVGNIRRTGERDARLSRTHSLLQLLLLLSHDLLHHKLLIRSRLGLRLTEHSAKKLLVQLICGCLSMFGWDAWGCLTQLMNNIH